MPTLEHGLEFLPVHAEALLTPLGTVQGCRGHQIVLGAGDRRVGAALAVGAGVRLRRQVAGLALRGHGASGARAAAAPARAVLARRAPALARAPAAAVTAGSPAHPRLGRRPRPTAPCCAPARAPACSARSKRRAQPAPPAAAGPAASRAHWPGQPTGSDGRERSARALSHAPRPHAARPRPESLPLTRTLGLSDTLTKFKPSAPRVPEGTLVTYCHFSVLPHRVHPSTNSQIPVSSCKAKFKLKVPACPADTQACLATPASLTLTFSIPTPGFHLCPYSGYSKLRLSQFKAQRGAEALKKCTQKSTPTHTPTEHPELVP